MDNIPLSVLYGTLVGLIVMSAFFSSSETGLMMLNRYRLRHLVKSGHPGARRAAALLDKPDRLIGLILLFNNAVNLLASSLVTIIALRHGGDAALAVGTGLLILVILIFAEVTPKTLAARHPERIAFPAAWVYVPLLKIFYPLVWIVNVIANFFLRLLGVRAEQAASLALSREELRTVLDEAGNRIPERHQKMLISILDLEKVTVEDIMVPRNEISGIDLDDDWDSIRKQISESAYTKLLVYRSNLDNALGFIHLRQVIRLLSQNELDKSDFEKTISNIYYTPITTPLHTMMMNFQKNRKRIGLVVDEYGDIQGLITLEDILEEIVGEFTTDPSQFSRDIYPQDDGSWLVDGSINLRMLNRLLAMRFPLDGPKTLNGLVLEYLEHIPEPGTSVLIANHPMEIIQTKEQSIKTVRISPRIEVKNHSDNKGNEE